MEDIIKKILAGEKGVLALDWSPSTIKKKFAEIGLDSEPELNRIYRQMLVTTPGLEKFVSAVILHDETVNQEMDSGKNFVEFLDSIGVVAGVRADDGSEKFEDSDEKITLGLEGLSERLEKYSQMGLRFTKWRAGFRITDIYPSKPFLEASVERLGKFAKTSQDKGLVPFVEPDVEIKGNHTTTRCAEVTQDVLKKLFEELRNQKVDLEKIILKTNMIVPGQESGVVAEPLEVAHATLRVLRNAVPKEVPGIVFLSGGIDYLDSTDYLDKIEDLSTEDPWELSFSFARALQHDAIKTWEGKDENVESAQTVLKERLEKIALARQGKL